MLRLHPTGVACPELVEGLTRTDTKPFALSRDSLPLGRLFQRLSKVGDYIFNRLYPNRNSHKPVTDTDPLPLFRREPAMGGHRRIEHFGVDIPQGGGGKA